MILTGRTTYNLEMEIFRKLNIKKGNQLTKKKYIPS